MTVCKTLKQEAGFPHRNHRTKKNRKPLRLEGSEYRKMRLKKMEKFD